MLIQKNTGGMEFSAGIRDEKSWAESQGSALPALLMVQRTCCQDRVVTLTPGSGTRKGAVSIGEGTGSNHRFIPAGPERSMASP